nr:MAG: RNA-dependent RNA polymerase [Rhizoctonia solani narnavirus 15]
MRPDRSREELSSHTDLPSKKALAFSKEARLAVKAAIVASGFWPTGITRRKSSTIFLNRLAKRVSRNPDRMGKCLKHCAYLFRKAGVEGSPLDQNALQAIPPVLRDRVKHGHANQLLQLSMFGRALPPPLSGKEEAIEKLVSINTSPPEEEEGLPQAALNALCAVLDLSKIKDPKDVSIPFSTGATVTSSRRDGGFSAEVAKHLFESDVLRRYPKLKGELEERPALQSTIDLVNSLAHHESGLPDDSVVMEPSVPLALPEQGCKWRIVTKSAFPILYRGHLDRKRTFCMLLEHQSTRIPLQEGKMSFAQFDEDQQLYSADLSNATDWLSHNAIEQICSVLGIDPGLVTSHVYDVDGNLVTPVRGTFMGLPPSWVVLSLTHLSICLLVDPSGLTFFLKGDDLVAYWTPLQWETYVALMEHAGFKVNLRKTFVSKTLATFCEKFYSKGRLSRLRKTEFGRVRFFDLVEENVISLRFITKRPDPRSVVPLHLAKAKRLREVKLQCRKVFYTFVRSVILRTCPKDIRFAAELPPWFGGLGLPKENSYMRSLTAWEKRIVSALHDGHIAPMQVSDLDNSELSQFVAFKTQKLDSLRKYWVSPPSDLDVLDGRILFRNLITRESVNGLLLGIAPKGSKSKRTFLSTRKAWVRSVARSATRLDDTFFEGWTLGTLYFAIQGPYLVVDDVEEACNSLGARFSGEAVSLMNPQSEFFFPEESF